MTHKLTTEQLLTTTKGQQTIIDNIVNSVAEQLSNVEPEARHSAFIQLRDKLAEQHAADITALEQPINERLNYLKSLKYE